MTEKILFVDDETNVLESIARQLRKRFSLSTAVGGQEALRIMKEQGPFAVIVSICGCPRMDGVQLLERVKELYPDTVRMMLTGNADQGTAIEAVNKGQIFKFLNKPSSTAVLVPAWPWLRGSTDSSPRKRNCWTRPSRAASRSWLVVEPFQSNGFQSRLPDQEYRGRACHVLNQGQIWKFETAGLMSQIRCIHPAHRNPA